MKYIDLFHGLGGFHVGLSRLGHNCVFACDADEELRRLYYNNFGVHSRGDIREVSVEDVPSHDILCAGFPCQPYSKAGTQQGLDCPKWGDLFFDHVLRIVNFHNPEYIILENVPNIQKHDQGQTWSRIIEAISRRYYVKSKIISPHSYGMPHNRERIFIIASRSDIDNFNWPLESHLPTSIRDVLEKNPPNARYLSDQLIKCINVWQEFVDEFPADEDLPSFPIWSYEFGATYPFNDYPPLSLATKDLLSYRGNFGIKLSSIEPLDIVACLPSYANKMDSQFPIWKKNLYCKTVSCIFGTRTG